MTSNHVEMTWKWPQNNIIQNLYSSVWAIFIETSTIRPLESSRIKSWYLLVGQTEICCGNSNFANIDEWWCSHSKQWWIIWYTVYQMYLLLNRIHQVLTDQRIRTSMYMIKRQEKHMGWHNNTATRKHSHQTDYYKYWHMESYTTVRKRWNSHQADGPESPGSLISFHSSSVSWMFLERVL